MQWFDSGLDNLAVSKKDIFRSFQEILKQLSPGDGEIIRPGRPVRVSVEDARDIPAYTITLWTSADNPYLRRNAQNSFPCIRYDMGLD